MYVSISNIAATTTSTTTTTIAYLVQISYQKLVHWCLYPFKRQLSGLVH